MIRKLKTLLSHRNPLRLGWHTFRVFLAALRYGFPARNLTVIGVTGTDGKTTTVAMVAHILEHAGVQTGALSTACFKIKGETTWNETQKTSPSPFVVQRFLRQLVHAGCTHAVLEYSSHGLVQGRMHCTWPAVAAITNTSMEHLDYHGSLEQYRADKALLFHMLRRTGTKVLNAEDDTFESYLRIPSERTIAYSGKDLRQETNNMSSCDVILWLSEQVTTQRSSSAQLNIAPSVHLKSHVSSLTSAKFDLTLAVPGAFNLENALCALSCAHALGIPIETSTKALQSFQPVPGRLERIDEGQPFAVYVDFTVTPQAFEKTLTSLRQMIDPGKRLHVLTGSCGDRMRQKRPIIGRLLGELADVVVITDDESYGEDPRKVMEEVWAAVDQSNVEAHKIFDRREAIRFILSKADEGDAVILCGLGSYPSRMTPKGPIPWNEQEIARTLLRNLQR